MEREHGVEVARCEDRMVWRSHGVEWSTVWGSHGVAGSTVRGAQYDREHSVEESIAWQRVQRGGEPW